MCEVRFRRKDGGTLDVALNAGKLSSDRFIAFCQDITRRKSLQNEVALRERQLKSFFLGATAGLTLLDKDLRYVQINDTLAEMNGLSVEDHLGRTLREVVPWLAPLAEPIFQKVFASGKPVLDVEMSGETQSQPGLQRHWMASFFPIAGLDGSPEYIGSMVVEITDRKRAEELLRQSEEQFRAMFELASIGIAQADPQTGRWLRVNQRIARSPATPPPSCSKCASRDHAPGRPSEGLGGIPAGRAGPGPELPP